MIIARFLQSSKNTYRRIRLFSSLRFEQTTLGLIFVTPLVIILLFFLGYPIISGILVSFQSKVIGSAGEFVGLNNYIELIKNDRAFKEVLFNTTVYTIGSVVLKLIFGFILAILLNEKIFARNFFRAWMLLPWIIPTLVTGLLWRWMFDQTGGVINYVLFSLDLIKYPPAWLASKDLARMAVIVANTWRGFPFFAMTFLAGLQSIPIELYEAAEMDGASVLQRILHITLPSIKPILLITVILSTIWTFNDFELLWVMTGGGPSYGTHIFVTYAYQLGFRGSSFGYATAVSLVALPLVVIFILLLLPRLWKEE